MALTTLTASCVTVVSAYQFGGQSGKKRKRLLVSLNDPAATSGGMVIGGAAGSIPASALGFTKIESCSHLQVYTTATGVTVRIYDAMPDILGTSIYLSDSGQTTGAVANATIATTESAQIELVGY